MENLNEKKQKQIKDKNINNKNNIHKTDIISELKEIFNHFSNNSKYLSNKNYKLFLIETSLLDDLNITPEYSNTLFYSFSSAKNCISFQSFYKLIMKIATIKFPKKYKESPENAFSFLFEIYLNPLLKIFHEMNSENNNKSELKKEGFIFNNINNKLIIQKIVSRMTKEIIENNYLLFLKLFQKYFCFENLKISITQKSHLSKKAFSKILSDFDIMPQYIDSERTENVFNIIIDNREYILNIMKNFINIDLCNNDGMYFTLFHFIIGIYLTSIVNIMLTSFDKNDTNNIWEIFVNNKDSKAFQNLLSLFYNSSNIKTIMNEDLSKMQLDILNDSMIKEKNKISSSLNNNESEKNLLTPINSKNETSDEKIEENLTYSKITPIILNKYKNQLISIYKYYSELFLETNFSVYMTQNGFINLIKDLNLLFTNEEIPKNYKKIPAHEKFLFQNKFINSLSFTSINIIFSKFSCIQINQNNKSINKKIDFMGFLNIILILSNKIFNPKFNNISFDDKLFSFDGLINSSILIKYATNFIMTYLNPLYLNILPKLEEDNFTIDNLMSILKIEKIKYIVNKLIPLLMRILKIYNDNKEFIEYSQYFKCLSDFNIFPDFVQRKKMIKIFINFIKDFDKIYLLKGNNKVVSELKSCVYGIIYIGIIGEDSEDLKNTEPEIKIFNFIYKLSQSQNLGKISILNIKNNLQKDFLNTLYEIHNYLIRDKKFKINEISKNNF